MSKLNNINITQNLNVLIVAENASNLFGGEAILPLHYFTFMRKLGVNCFLLTNSRNKNRLQMQLSKELNQYVFYIADTWLQMFLASFKKHIPDRLFSLTLALIIQFISSRAFKNKTKNLITKLNINTIHQPTPVSPKQPSNMFGFGIPVVIGPMNGGMTYPSGLEIDNNTEKYFQSILTKISELANFIIPGKKKAAILLVANERTKAALPKTNDVEIEIFPENGVDLHLMDSITPNRSMVKQNFHLVYIGRLIEWKAVDLLLRAIDKVKNKYSLSLTIVGDGALRQKIEDLILELELNELVELTGHLEQDEAFAILKSANALILPSLYECGGAVVLEAMACSKPVLATNWGGPTDYLTNETGILIDTGTSKSEFITNIGNAICRIIENPDLANEMGLLAQNRVEKFYSWEQKTHAMHDIYLKHLKMNSALLRS